MRKLGNFHKGHNVILVPHQNRAHLYCQDCGVLADFETVSAEVSVEDALQDFKANPEAKVTPLSKLTKGVTL